MFDRLAPLVWVIVTTAKEEVDVQTSRRGFLQLLAGSVMTAALTGCAPGSSALTVTFLDVGKADAMVLSTAGYTVMVDTGTASSATAVVDALNNLGVSTINELVITHFDQDHVGGVPAVLDSFPVDEVIVTYESKESDEVNAYHEAIKNHGIDVVEVRSETERVYDDVKYTIIPPARESYDKDTSNNSSLVVRVRFGTVSMLLTGDIQHERIEELIAAGTDLSANLLKVPHHGKEEDNSARLFAAVSPMYAVITSSKDDKESDAVVKELENCSARVFLTRKGAVTAITDGKTLKVTQ